MLLPILSLYPTATTEAIAESSLFIAAQLRTGPACLSQDPAVDPLTTASDWLTERKRRTTELRGERKRPWRFQKPMQSLTLWWPELGNTVAWKQQRKRDNKRKWEWKKGQGSQDRHSHLEWEGINEHFQSITHFPWAATHHAILTEKSFTCNF